MKFQAILLATYLLPGLLFAEPAKGELPGFLGIPWGASPDEAKKQFTSRTHARPDRVKSDENKLVFTGGRFAGFKLRETTLLFAAHQFFDVELFLEASSPKNEKEFAALKAMLSEKYGPPGRDETTGSGLEANWYFPIPGSPSPTIWIIQNSSGDAVKAIYLSEGIKFNAQKAAKAASTPAPAAKPAKPVVGNSSNKDDL